MHEAKAVFLFKYFFSVCQLCFISSSIVLCFLILNIFTSSIIETTLTVEMHNCCSEIDTSNVNKINYLSFNVIHFTNKIKTF